MVNGLEIYKIWAPPDAFWSQWAKPVLFVGKAGYTATQEPTAIADVHWLTIADFRTAYIVDLPGEDGVEEGLGLARLGYRPVPLYNGVDGPPRARLGNQIVDVKPIVEALANGASTLHGMTIRADAPPVFLLDANRMNGIGKQPGTYDNRWCVFLQDFPSSTCLLEHGIERVIVRSAHLQTDLQHIVYKYQKDGIVICLCAADDTIRQIQVAKPHRFEGLMYRTKVFAGLYRNAVGGFGALVPFPTQGSRYSYG